MRRNVSKTNDPFDDQMTVSNDQKCHNSLISVIENICYDPWRRLKRRFFKFCRYK